MGDTMASATREGGEVRDHRAREVAEQAEWRMIWRDDQGRRYEAEVRAMFIESPDRGQGRDIQDGHRGHQVRIVEHAPRRHRRREA